MEGIFAVYVLMSLYLCGLTHIIWWGLLILCTVTHLTGMMGLMLYEIVTVIIIWWLMMDSNTFERSSANTYMGWFSLSLGFLLISNVDLAVISLLTILISLSKLPVFSLHQWLPKVHVEASIVSSMILAGLILNMSIVFVSLYGSGHVLFIIGVTCGVMMMLSTDGKVVMAYSSVVHMSFCSAVMGWIGAIIGASHVVVSPLMFIAVYCGYMGSGSRLVSHSYTSWIIGVILIVNLSFPLVGAFIAEVYLIVILSSVVLLIFMLSYFAISITHVNLFFNMKSAWSVEVNSWIVIITLLY